MRCSEPGQFQQMLGRRWHTLEHFLRGWATAEFLAAANIFLGWERASSTAITTCPSLKSLAKIYGLRICFLTGLCAANFRSSWCRTQRIPGLRRRKLPPRFRKFGLRKYCESGLGTGILSSPMTLPCLRNTLGSPVANTSAAGGAAPSVSRKRSTVPPSMSTQVNKGAETHFWHSRNKRHVCRGSLMLRANRITPAGCSRRSREASRVLISTPSNPMISNCPGSCRTSSVRSVCSAARFLFSVQPTGSEPPVA